MWNPLAWRKTTWTLVGVGALGAIAGVVAWGGFNTAMEATNSIAFCVSCHEMRDTVYKEYQTSIHYKNPAGVRATCPDCHVPKDWIPKVARKVQATNELWHKLAGTIDTPEKFQAARASLAKEVWKTMKDTDSRECRNCHSFEAMDFAHQRPKAAERMQKAYNEGGQTCIDCHKGIAHKLPDMTAGFKAVHDDLASGSKSLTPVVGSTLYTLSTKPFWLDRPKSEGDASAGKLLPLTPLEVLERDGPWVKVKFGGWQQEGAERMVYALQGKRIFAAALGPDAIDKVAHGQTMKDADTDQQWTEASLVGWTTTADLVADRSKLFGYGAEMYNASCGLCHSLTPTTNYLANQWIGNLNAMKRNISLDDEQYRFLQKYVQLNAQDTGGAKEAGTNETGAKK
ncbi:trimethylamine-N-oxide reductase cytochrome c-type subunit TorC [Roseiarcus fermentans]|uniref:Cytochrome c-type protein n=1 Tax=Roseiarcus fermentans TaxID=1473586 RepID=A0A366FJ32_9HYPH|nr:NapC/NirT family cytochrome c [Roseiarcus fermentans]RBP14126.1 trimethylamine-N-oxide reductase cytochrome c-type subunit TorC [Roseiarcus fermentans]